jgi:hypothetical protein
MNADVPVGIPMTDLTLVQNQPNGPTLSHLPNEKSCASDPAILHLPGSISFVRSRMLFAKAALNAHGAVRFGLRHIRESDQHIPELKLTV